MPAICIKVYIKYLPGDTKPNIVRENSGIVHVVVAMNCINPINHRNPETGR